MATDDNGKKGWLARAWSALNRPMGKKAEELSERRGSERVDTRLDLVVKGPVGESAPGWTVNMSSAGFCIRCERVWKEGTEVEVSVPGKSPGDAPLALSALVIWATLYGELTMGLKVQQASLAAYRLLLERCRVAQPAEKPPERGPERTASPAKPAAMESRRSPYLRYLQRELERGKGSGRRR